MFAIKLKFNNNKKSTKNVRINEIINIKEIWKNRNNNMKNANFIKSISLNNKNDYKSFISNNVLNNNPIVINNLQSNWNSNILRYLLLLLHLTKTYI